MRMLLTLRDGRKTLIEINSIRDIVELDKNYCEESNTELEYSYTALYRTPVDNHTLLVREDIYEIEALINKVKP